MKPLVSILIPAYNAEEWIAETIQSAIAQTWQRKEILIVDDGSTDRTAEVAERFQSTDVKVVRKDNEGAAATRNCALQLSQGHYIQWLDADDLLAPDKIQLQMDALAGSGDTGLLLSSEWASFSHRKEHGRFVGGSLWQNLPPVEWLVTRMRDNQYMQTATWLTSRELAEAAGPWDTSLLSDDDVEYFCRVILASKGTRFVSGAKVFYRIGPLSRLSYIGPSDRKKDALLMSMKSQIQQVRSHEDSERVRKACLTYMQNELGHFYPERPDIVNELQALAAQLGGQLAVRTDH